MKLSRIVVVALSWGLLGATSTPAKAQSAVAELQIAPSQVELQIGERRSLLVTAFDRAGNVVPSVRYEATTETAVVRLGRDPSSPNILYVEGVGYGVTTVSVRAGSVVATASVRVAEGSPSEGPVGVGEASVLRIEPANIFLLPTEELQLNPLFLKDDGAPAARSRVTWRSLLETVATVSDRGVVVGISPGQGVIEGRSSNGLTARSLVRVANETIGFSVSGISLSPLESDTVHVVIPSENNRPVASRQLRWATTDPRVINVTPLGEVTGIAPGSAEIVVMGFGQQHSLPVRVHRPVEFMIVSPPQSDEVAVPMGGSIEFSVTLQDENHVEVPEARVFWTVEDPSIATFDPATNRLSGTALGNTQLTARGPTGIADARWNVRVVAGAIAINSSRIGLVPNQQLRLGASYQDETGENLGEAQNVSWQSANPAVAEVRDDGVLVGLSWGHTQVIASTAWGAVDTADVYVQGELLVTSTRTGNGDVYALDPSAPGTLNQLTTDPSSAEVGASYSPDGTSIAFIATANGNAEVFVMNADGSGARQVTNTATSEGSPRWTPDGSRIVYEVADGDGTNIWIMQADGSDQRALTTGDAINGHPAVSPDGQTVAYATSAGGNRQVFLMNIDGSNARAVTPDDRNYRSPAWFPDGRLAYTAEERVRRRTVRAVIRLDLATGESENLTPGVIEVSDFAISRDGGQMALILQTESRRRRFLRLFIMPLAGPNAGVAIEVPVLDDGEQFVFPFYKP